MASASPLKVPEGWGSIEQVVNAPLIGVPADAWWISVIGMWLFLPVNLLMGIIGGLCQAIIVCYSIGSCCPLSRTCASAYGSVQAGRPLYMAWVWWQYMIGGLVALMANGGSRLALFLWEWKAFGNGKYYWHGEGIWSPLYEDCDKILRSEQQRKSAFGCIVACIPDLFATDILIFLSNGPDTQWAAIRQVLHKSLLDPDSAAYTRRLGEMKRKVAEAWPNPQLTDFNDTSKVQKTVAKCIMFMMFNVWITEDEAQILTGWRTNASFFILPRLIQRFVFNYGINKVKQLRVDTMHIVVRNNLAGVFTEMNEALPSRWQRHPTVKFADEIMYVIGFAGIGGTSACVESVGAFLQVKKPKESDAGAISFVKYPNVDAMKAAYKKNPEAYIRETCRMDPPVTSATQVLKQTGAIDIAGTKLVTPEGMLNQYVLSIANRDDRLFPEPSVFNPERPNLAKALTWNGAWGTKDDVKNYPRICPGRDLALSVARTITDHVMRV